MEAHHALLLETCDAETDGRARFMGHSVFEEPNTPPCAMKHEGIEVRTMASSRCGLTTGRHADAPH